MYEKTLCLILDSCGKVPSTFAGEPIPLNSTIYFSLGSEWQRGKTLIKTPAAETHLKPKTHIILIRTARLRLPLSERVLLRSVRVCQTLFSLKLSA